MPTPPMTCTRMYIRSYSEQPDTLYDTFRTQECQAILYTKSSKVKETFQRHRSSTEGRKIIVQNIMLTAVPSSGVLINSTLA